MLGGLSKLLAKGGLWLGLGISAVLAIGSIALVAFVVIQWPPDHFKPHLPGSRAEVRRHLLAAIGKNIGGGFDPPRAGDGAAGIPGQGLLTMIVGLTMIDFPGKQRLERRLIGRPHVLRAINRLRARFQRAPLEM